MRRQLIIYFTYVFFVSATIMVYSCQSDSRSKKNTSYGTSIDKRRSTIMLDLIRTEEMFAAGELHQALGLIDELVSKKPQWADPYLLKGNIFTSVDQHDKAKSSYEKLVKIDPDYLSAWFKLGNNNIGSQYLLKADSIQTLYSSLENLKLAADRNPDNQRKWLELAKAYDSVGMKVEAGQARFAAQFTNTLKNK